MTGTFVFFGDLPPEAQRQVVAIARAQGLPVPGGMIRSARKGKARGVAAAPAEALPAGSHGVEAAAEVRAWPLRLHRRCGWQGVGLCTGCGR